VHPRHQVALRGFQRQMIVIAHEHIRVEHPAGLGARLEQTVLERRPRPLGLEDMCPVIATVDHVVARPGEFESQLARHARQSAGAASAVNVNIRSLTLFSLLFITFVPSF